MRRELEGGAEANGRVCFTSPLGGQARINQSSSSCAGGEASGLGESSTWDGTVRRESGWGPEANDRVCFTSLLGGEARINQIVFLLRGRGWAFV